MAWTVVVSLGVGGFIEGGDDEPCLEDDGIASNPGVPTLDVGAYPREGKG
jgi:hypothetical protein